MDWVIDFGSEYMLVSVKREIDSCWLRWVSVCEMKYDESFKYECGIPLSSLENILSLGCWLIV